VPPGGIIFAIVHIACGIFFAFPGAAVFALPYLGSSCASPPPSLFLLLQSHLLARQYFNIYHRRI